MDARLCGVCAGSGGAVDVDLVGACCSVPLLDAVLTSAEVRLRFSRRGCLAEDAECEYLIQIRPMDAAASADQAKIPAFS